MVQAVHSSSSREDEIRLQNEGRDSIYSEVARQFSDQVVDRAHQDNKINSTEDCRRTLNLVRQKLSSEWLKSQRVLNPGAEKEQTKAYKLLRTQVLRKMYSNDWSRLAVVSPRRGHGNTLTAINLALCIAHTKGCQVSLFDLNLNNPMVGYYLNLNMQNIIKSNNEQELQNLGFQIEGLNLQVFPNLAKNMDLGFK